MFRFNPNPQCRLSPEDAEKWPQLVHDYTEPYFSIRLAGAMDTGTNAPTDKKRWISISYSSERGDQLPFEPDYHEFAQNMPHDDEEEEEVIGGECEPEGEEEISESAADIIKLLDELENIEAVVTPEDYVLVGIDFRKDAISLIYQATAALPDGHHLTMQTSTLVPYTAFFDPFRPGNKLELLIDVFEGSDEDDPEADVIETYYAEIGIEPGSEAGSGIAYVEYTGEPIPEGEFAQGEADFDVDLEPSDD